MPALRAARVAAGASALALALFIIVAYKAGGMSEVKPVKPTLLPHAPAYDGFASARVWIETARSDVDAWAAIGEPREHMGVVARMRLSERLKLEYATMCGTAAIMVGVVTLLHRLLLLAGPAQAADGGGGKATAPAGHPADWVDASGGLRPPAARAEGGGGAAAPAAAPQQAPVPPPPQSAGAAAPAARATKGFPGGFNGVKFSLYITFGASLSNATEHVLIQELLKAGSMAGIPKGLVSKIVWLATAKYALLSVWALIVAVAYWRLLAAPRFPTRWLHIPRFVGSSDVLPSTAYFASGLVGLALVALPVSYPRDVLEFLRMMGAVCAFASGAHAIGAWYRLEVTEHPETLAAVAAEKAAEKAAAAAESAKRASKKKPSKAARAPEPAAATAAGGGGETASGVAAAASDAAESKSSGAGGGRAAGDVKERSSSSGSDTDDSRGSSDGDAQGARQRRGARANK